MSEQVGKSERFDRHDEFQKILFFGSGHQVIQTCPNSRNINEFILPIWQSTCFQAIRYLLGFDFWIQKICVHALFGNYH